MHHWEDVIRNIDHDYSNKRVASEEASRFSLDKVTHGKHMTADKKDSAFIEELYSVRLWSIIGTVQPYKDSIEDA